MIVRDSRPRSILTSIVTCLWLAGGIAAAQDREGPRLDATVGVLQKPGSLPFEERYLQQLKVPSGFAVNVFAALTGNLRMMAVDATGGVYVTRQEQGDVVLLREMPTATVGLTTCASSRRD